MIEMLIAFFLQWWIWLPLILILAYLTWRNYQTKPIVDNYDYVLLSLEVPRDNDKKELSAEQLFSSLHGVLRSKQELKMSGGLQEHFSFEVASVGNQIRFYVRVPKHLQSFVEGQIYAQYPAVQIHEAAQDYARTASAHAVTAIDELVLTDNQFLPIKTFQNFEVDPLAGITAAISKLNKSDEEIWIQILARPIADDWQSSSAKFVARCKSGIGSGKFDNFSWAAQLVEALWQPPEASAAGKTAELSDRDKLRVQKAEEKASQKLGYKVKIRIAYLGDDQEAARIQLNAVASAFKQFNSTSLNGFKLAARPSFERSDLAAYVKREFPQGDGFILNTEELASVFHLPHMNVETPNVVWANSKTAEPPTDLPVLNGNREHDHGISAFGITNFRGMQQQFGIYRRDRGRHVYIIGQTGTGKSGLLELLTLSDIYQNQGYAIIDPHGDFAIDNLRFIPESRLKDVIYFNPADTAYPMAFNPMEISNPALRSNISSEIIGVLKRMFGESWGPRLEYILRYTILALLEYPDSTMLDITRMLTDKTFRKQVVDRVTDTVVLQFWRVEFASWSEKYMTEAVAPILNKVGAFVANPTIRNIIGQPKSSFNIRQIMDEGKILIVNLSKGLIGEDNASILGSFLVTKIQLAAMSRSDIPNVADRRPFYLYVDEFQNFATDSFAVILSEARKYGLNLTVANQYISQMSDTVRDAVFGNVGTMISMRVSNEDAPILAQQFAPNFSASDIMQMGNRCFISCMMINGEKTQSFSGTTLKLPTAPTDHLDAIIANSRAQYGHPVAEVSAQIEKLIKSSATAMPVAPSRPAADTPRYHKPTEEEKELKRAKKISPNGTSGSQNLKDLFAAVKQAAAAPDQVTASPAPAAQPAKPARPIQPVQPPAKQPAQPTGTLTLSHTAPSSEAATPADQPDTPAAAPIQPTAPEAAEAKPKRHRRRPHKKPAAPQQ